jgi:hypothetical protein
MTSSLLADAVPPRPEFRARLDAARTQASSEVHSFSRDWAAGKLSKRQMGFWAMQHWYYIDRVPQQFGVMYARCPDVDARLIILDNLIGEEAAGGRHPDLLLDFAEACGYPKDEVRRADRDGRILPTARGMRGWIEELVQSRHIVEQAAGIMVALEGQTSSTPASATSCASATPRRPSSRSGQSGPAAPRPRCDSPTSTASRARCASWADTRPGRGAGPAVIGWSRWRGCSHACLRRRPAQRAP